MNILVKIRNQKEERVLLAFLAKRGYEFEAEDSVEKEAIETSAEDTNSLEQLDAEIEKGNYADHRKVEMMLHQRRTTV